MAKRKTYTDKYKAGAVVMAHAEGYPDDKYAVGRVAKHLGMQDRTLRRWLSNEHGDGSPPDDIVQEQKTGIIDLIDGEIRAAFKQMDAARVDASYRDLGTVIGIMFDKVQLLQGKPTAINEAVEQVDFDFSTMGTDELAAFAASLKEDGEGSG